MKNVVQFCTEFLIFLINIPSLIFRKSEQFLFIAKI